MQFFRAFWNGYDGRVQRAREAARLRRWRLLEQLGPNETRTCSAVLWMPSKLEGEEAWKKKRLDDEDSLQARLRLFYTTEKKNPPPLLCRPRHPLCRAFGSTHKLEKAPFYNKRAQSLLKDGKILKFWERHSYWSQITEKSAWWRFIKSLLHPIYFKIPSIHNSANFLLDYYLCECHIRN